VLVGTDGGADVGAGGAVSGVDGIEVGTDVETGALQAAASRIGIGTAASRSSSPRRVTL